MPNARMGKRRSRWWWWLLAPLIILAATAAAGFVYLQYLGLRPWSNFTRPFTPPFDGLRQINILVLGVDGNAEARRSDTIMIARLDLSQSRIGVISIPRDFRAVIPGHTDEKINAAYSLGGVELTCATIEGLIGVKCDYYITINSEGLARLVDALGGVEVNVDKLMRYHDHAQKLVIDLQPGLQRLNGQQAVGYVRFRRDRMGDLTRIQRQQTFLRAVLQEALQPRNLPRLPGLLRLFAKAVQTDLTLEDLRAISSFAKNIDSKRVEAATLPGTPVTIRGVSYLEPDPTQMARVVEETLFNAPPRVAIVNATEIPGVESDLVKRLNGAGYQVMEVRQAQYASATTEVIDPVGDSEEAARIRGWVHCGTVVRANGQEVPGADITVLLGTDYLGTHAE